MRRQNLILTGVALRAVNYFICQARVVGAFCIALLLCLAPATDLLADQRVLISFDVSGHQVRKVIYTVNQYNNPALLQRSRVSQTLQPAVASGTATWLDINGQVLLVVPIDDPRVTHTPIINGFESAPNWVVLESGAYLVQGPENATQVQLELPARPGVALSAESWLLNLR